MPAPSVPVAYLGVEDRGEVEHERAQLDELVVVAHGTAVISGLMIGTSIVALVLMGSVKNSMRAAPSAPEFAFARWTTCDAAGGALATQAMRVPRGVLIRTADAPAPPRAAMPGERVAQLGHDPLMCRGLRVRPVDRRADVHLGDSLHCADLCGVVAL